MVDAVSEFLNIKAGDIEETPNFGSRLQTGYIPGMAKVGEGIKIPPEIDRVLRAEELESMSIAA